MEAVALVVVGVVLLVVVALFAWSAVRGVSASRLRGPRRVLADGALPHGLVEGLREPPALRAPFALSARGEVVDVGQAWTGAFRGHELGLVDAHVRLGAGAPPVAHTIATVDVEHAWPWTRLRPVGLPAVAVDVPCSEVAGGWLVESRDPAVAAGLAASELPAWLARLGRPALVELTPRHVLVAVPERLPDEELAAFVELAAGVVDQVPPALRERPASPPPEAGPRHR